MIIGVPKEIKNNEFRVGLTPGGAHLLVSGGHRVFVQKGAGEGSGMADHDYAAAGAELLGTLEEVYDRAEMIIKVKEPLAEEYPLIKKDQILFTYLHLAPEPELTRVLLKSGCIAVAYETVQMPDGSLPLLHPMSEVAGRMAPQAGAHHLEKASGGRGVLLGGVPGVARSNVVIIGGGTAGLNACKIAVGLGANVSIMDINPGRLAYLDDIFENRISTEMASPENISRALPTAELVIGAVLIPGARAPAIVTREMVADMAAGSVLIDISIDQGGCFETSRPTTHENPTYTVDGVVHYCVANIPGAVPRTSTLALTNVTLPYAAAIAAKGIERAVREDRALSKGVNIYKGRVTCAGVSEAMNESCEDVHHLVK